MANLETEKSLGRLAKTIHRRDHEKGQLVRTEIHVDQGVYIEIIRRGAFIQIEHAHGLNDGKLEQRTRVFQINEDVQEGNPQTA